MRARSVAVAASVSTGRGALCARGAGTATSANTDGHAVSARGAEEAAFASTGGGAVSARIAEVPASANMTGSGIHGGISARSVQMSTLVARLRNNWTICVWHSYAFQMQSQEFHNQVYR